MDLLYDVPELLVGFDVESTGLDTANDEAISYGFAAYRKGQLVEQEEFFVLPDVQIHPGAEKIHGVSFERLARMHREGTALSSRAGATRAATRLLRYANEGALFVGANPMFDWSMLDATLRRQNGDGLIFCGLDLSMVSMIDVVKHDVALDPDRSKRPRRGLAFLCDYYDVTPGEHQAGEDARAAVEVLLAQVSAGQQLRQQRSSNQIIESETRNANTATSRMRVWARSLFAR